MERIKAAGYARVSTIGQMDGTSPEEQKKAIEQECANKDYELFDFYSDAATGKNTDRPGLKKLLFDAKDGKFQILLFTRLDRLGRNLRDILNTLHEISNSYGVEFFCIEQPQVNGTGPNSKLMLNILSAFAEFERDLIKGRTKSGRLAVWKSGAKTIGSLPFGYVRSNKEINVQEEKVEIYNQIVTLYLDQGYSLRDIANKLKNDGVPSPSGKSNNWFSMTISDILKNPAYKGEAYQNQFKAILHKGKNGSQYFASSNEQRPETDWIKVNFPPLISEERFNQIQLRIEAQKRKPKKRHYGNEEHFLADSVLYCKHCGAKVRKQFTPNANFHYCCYWYSASPKELKMMNRKKCKLHYHDAEKIDFRILDAISELMSSPNQFAKDWFKQSDIEELKEKVENLKNRNLEMRDALSKAFSHFNSVRDPELKRVYKDDIDKMEKDFLENKKNLQSFEMELKATNYKNDRLKEFKKRMKGGLRQQASTYFKIKNEFENFIFLLPFREKKRIIEAIISPENNGKIYLMNDPEDSSHFELDFDFKLDIDKIERIISSLNKNELLNKVDSG